MSEAMDTLYDLLRIVFLANQENSVSYDLNTEAESLVDTTHKAKEIAQRTSTCKNISRQCCFVCRVHNSFHSRCDGVLGVPCGIRVAEVGAIVFG